jgi:AcrR family transcriptional regulator
MPRPRGRPRDTDTDERILRATLEGLATVGYQALSVDEVAAKAGVAKTTIYRRWPTKEELVANCLQERARRESPPPTGDWRDDIRRWVAGLINHVNTPEGKAWNSVLAASYNNPNLGVSFTRQDDFVVPLSDALREGVARGELRADLDVDLATDMLAAVVIFRTFLLREPVDEALADSIVDLVLNDASSERSLTRRRPKARPDRRTG